MMKKDDTELYSAIKLDNYELFLCSTKTALGKHIGVSYQTIKNIFIKVPEIQYNGFLISKSNKINRIKNRAKNLIK